MVSISALWCYGCGPSDPFVLFHNTIHTNREYGDLC